MGQTKTPTEYVQSWRKLHRESPVGATLLALGLIVGYLSLGTIAWGIISGGGPPQSVTVPPVLGVAGAGVVLALGMGLVATAAIKKLRNRVAALEAMAE